MGARALPWLVAIDRLQQKQGCFSDRVLVDLMAAQEADVKDSIEKLYDQIITLLLRFDIKMVTYQT